MFIISYHILGTRITWNDEFYFKSKALAEQYLISKSFIKSGSVFFDKEYSGWFPKTSASIILLKLKEEL